mgnify:CR=1 FL=1
MRLLGRICVALLLAVISTAARALQSAPSPAGPGSFAPFLTTDRQGRILLSWLENRVDGGHRFRFARRSDGGEWSPPLTIGEGPDFFANWADVPSVFVATNGTMVAHWLQKRGEGPESYDIKIRTSTDNGATWSPARSPHRDSVEAQHGFVSFFDVPDGIGLVWLDGRDMNGHGGSMTLRSTTLTGWKLDALGNEVVIDPRVCDCCPTAAAVSGEGPIVAYRDRSADEVRDIAVSRWVRSVWSPPTLVHADRWKINACPVNGPAIAARGTRVAVAWHTGLSSRDSQVNVAFSSDAGRTFGQPVRLDGGAPIGRVGLAMIDDQRLAATWLETAGGVTRVLMRTVDRNGLLGPSVPVAAVGNSRQTGLPRVTVAGRKLLFAWTAAEPSAPTHVVIKEVDIQ